MKSDLKWRKKNHIPSPSFKHFLFLPSTTEKWQKIRDEKKTV